VSRSIGLALIGCGNNMSNAHIPRLLDLNDVSIVALVDPVTATLQALQERHPALATTTAFTDHTEMLAAVEPEAVVISSPHAFHHPQIIASLQAGAHVLVEKPMVNTAAEAREVIATRDDTGKMVMVSYQRRFGHSEQQMNQVIKSGGIGAVEFVTAQLYQSWYTHNLSHIQQDRQPWRVRQHLSGGGQLNDSGSHLLDIVLHLVGLPAKRVTAQQQQFTLDVAVAGMAPSRSCQATSPSGCARADESRSALH